MGDQTGYTVNYTYDALGDLATLTDGSGNLIAQYTYDAVDRLARQDDGNGTYTTYAYDAAGELLHIVNYAPGRVHQLRVSTTLMTAWAADQQDDGERHMDLDIQRNRRDDARRFRLHNPAHCEPGRGVLLRRSRQPHGDDHNSVTNVYTTNE